MKISAFSAQCRFFGGPSSSSSSSVELWSRSFRDEEASRFVSKMKDSANQTVSLNLIRLMNEKTGMA